MEGRRGAQPAPGLGALPTADLHPDNRSAFDSHFDTGPLARKIILLASSGVT